MAVKTYLKLFSKYIIFNIKSALHYRVSFISQIVFMALNNVIFLVFWWIFFINFENIQGWHGKDIYILYAIVSISYGISHILFGNIQSIPKLIAEGELDGYLVQPKNPLIHISIGRMSVAGIGDVLFGIVLVLLFLKLTASNITILMLLCILSSLLFSSFVIILGSLSFFIGRSSELSVQLQNILITFSTYPGTLFEGFVKLILFTGIPAGFMGYIPLQLIKNFRLSLLAIYLGAVAFFLLLAFLLFHIGLRRYESGNLIVAKI